MPKSINKAIESLTQSIISETAGLDIAARLGALGFPRSPELAETFAKLAKRLCTDQPSVELFPVIIIDFLNAPYPEGALLNLLRYTETTGSPNVLLVTLAQAGPLREILATTFGSSQYMADIIIRNPGSLYWLIEKRTWEEEETTAFFETELKREIAHFNTRDGKLNAVRRFHRMGLLRIGVQDLIGIQSIETTTERLSNLADAIVGTVLEILWQDLSGKFEDVSKTPSKGNRSGANTSASHSGQPVGSAGRPHAKAGPPLPPNTGFCVIAMGKLGGRELNYSSDIDLIYLCEEAENAALSFYHMLAQSLTEALSEVTEEGYLYRVDLRLRPDGSSGPLVNSMTSMRIYYENRGKPWEFQAMLKARPIAGDFPLGESFLENISNLIFNPSLPYSPVEDIAHMRARIQESIPVRKRPFNIKLMEGGIRDIEFIVQTLQLLHGSRYPDIRVPGTLEALDRIHKRKLLKKTESKSLADAYRYLRLVEHRLQMMHQIKTHTVPEFRDEVVLIAARVSKGPLGNYSYNDFIQTLTRHLKNVRILSESFFSTDRQEVHSLLFLMPETNPEALKLLERCGVTHPDNAIKVIHTMAYGSFPRLLDRKSRVAFADLLPHLLESVSKTGDPGLTLTNVSRIAAAGKSEYTFYTLLSESNAARALVTTLAGVSSRLTGHLCSRIESLDPLLVDPHELVRTSLENLPQWQDLEQSKTKKQPHGETAGDVLQKRLKQSLDRLHLGAFLADFKSGTFPETLTSSRALFAKRMISSAFETALGGDTPAALFVLGSFSVGEPRFGSDADLLVVSDAGDNEDIVRKIQAINRIFTEGMIFKLDFRLRGEGANAPLVQDMRFYDSYFKKRMSLWERIAFSKIGFWWGSQRIADSILGTLAEHLARPFEKKEIESLFLMRKKLESLAAKTRETWETKQSAGGRYDIEYICGIGIPRILRGGDFPFLASTVERLRMLEEAGLLSSDDFNTCRGALELYARLEYVLELQGFSAPHSEERECYLVKYTERTLDYLGFPLRQGIKEEIKETKQAIRSVFDRFIERAC